MNYYTFLALFLMSQAVVALAQNAAARNAVGRQITRTAGGGRPAVNNRRTQPSLDPLVVATVESAEPWQPAPDEMHAARGGMYSAARETGSVSVAAVGAARALPNTARASDLQRRVPSQQLQQQQEPSGPDTPSAGEAADVQPPGPAGTPDDVIEPEPSPSPEYSQNPVPQPDQGLESPQPDPVASPAPEPAESPSPEPVTSPSPEPVESPLPSPSPSPSPAPSPEACTQPLQEAEPVPLGVPIPALNPGQKPNFIVILTDDQGWDDIGLHNPYVITPNINKFILNGTKFDNFYVAPQCAQTRAELLTGRSHARVGTMLVHGAWDFINHEEVNAAKFMAAKGYKTAHFGKWHNGEATGYQPWSVGFQDSWYTPNKLSDGLMINNGEYVQSKGYTEEVLMDKILEYISNQTASSQPFFLYYGVRLIHVSGEESDNFRSFPPQYRAAFADEKYADLPRSTIAAWSMLHWLDDILGRLFSYLESSPLRNNTYIMLASDNGPQLLLDEQYYKNIRMPSNMRGSKGSVDEGGIRNFLAVQGPGVEAGVIDSTLLHITDILPTMADLAASSGTNGDNSKGVTAHHLQWDGISFKNLLQPKSVVMSDGYNATAARNGRRLNSLQSQEQKERYIFSLRANCFSPNDVPLLGEDREVLKPQPLLDFERFLPCIAIRHKSYKWGGFIGATYRFTNNSHVEMMCNELPTKELPGANAYFTYVASRWWDSVVSEPHSFVRPTFFLGLDHWLVTNVIADAAHERTMGNITIVPNGASGFRGIGDRMCFKLKVLQADVYEFVLIYTADVTATFRLSVGSFSDIMSGAALSLTTILPAQNVMTGQYIGSLGLSVTPPSEKQELCLELVDSTAPGTPVFTNLANIRVTKGVTVIAPPSLEQPGTPDTPTLPTPVPLPSPEPGSEEGSSIPDEGDAAPDVLASPVSTGTSHKQPPMFEPLPSPVPRPDKGVQPDMGWMPASIASVQLSGNGVATKPLERSINGVVPRKAVPVAVPGFTPSHYVPGSIRQRSAAGMQRPAPRGLLSETSPATGSLLAPSVTPAVRAPGLDLSSKYKWITETVVQQSIVAKESLRSDPPNWTSVRLRYGWPDGQYALESMWSPYGTEGMDDCAACHPRIA